MLCAVKSKGTHLRSFKAYIFSLLIFAMFAATILQVKFFLSHEIESPSKVEKIQSFTWLGFTQESQKRIYTLKPRSNDLKDLLQLIPFIPGKISKVQFIAEKHDLEIHLYH